jgi:hypothetical protein
MSGEEHDLQKVSLKGCAPIFWVWLVLFVIICGGLNVGIEQGWWK